jgi:hypothetical protein
MEINIQEDLSIMLRRDRALQVLLIVIIIKVNIRIILLMVQVNSQVLLMDKRLNMLEDGRMEL